MTWIRQVLKNNGFKIRKRKIIKMTKVLKRNIEMYAFGPPVAIRGGGVV